MNFQGKVDFEWEAQGLNMFPPSLPQVADHLGKGPTDFKELKIILFPAPLVAMGTEGTVSRTTSPQAV